MTYKEIVEKLKEGDEVAFRTEWGYEWTNDCVFVDDGQIKRTDAANWPTEYCPNNTDLKANDWQISLRKSFKYKI